MSEPENFIARWARRKRAAAEDVEEKKSVAASDVAAEGAHPTVDERKESEPPVARSGDLPQLPFDPASLPSLESITAETDIRAFLAPGVPAELTRAALRRAWAADPQIREFIGLSENSWDFNAPGSMAGFGPLEMTDELRRQIARMVGRSLAGGEIDRPASTSAEVQGGPPPTETSTESTATTAAMPTQQAQSNDGTSQNEPVKTDDQLHNWEGFPQRDKERIATQYDAEKLDNDQSTAKRPHGRALPKL
jgi:hypothetical protein